MIRAIGLVALAGVILTLLAVREEASGACSVASLDAAESEYLCLLNEYRAQNGLGSVAVSQTLQCAAEWMSNDLVVHGYFSHTSSDGRLPWQRAYGCGYPTFAGVGEILAGGFESPAAVLAAWKGSPGHNAAMLTPQYVAVGISRQAGGIYGWTWVVDFGTVLDVVVPLPTLTPTPTLTPRPTMTPTRRYLPAIAKDGP